MVAEGGILMKTVKFYSFHRTLFLVKSRARFLLLIMDGRHMVVYSINSIHFGFLIEREEKSQSCEACRERLAPHWRLNS